MATPARELQQDELFKRTRELRAALHAVEFYALHELPVPAEVTGLVGDAWYGFAVALDAYRPGGRGD